MNLEELDRKERLDLASQFLADPCAAHEVLFGGDNVDVTPDFHRELITAFHGPEENVIAVCFRGSAKSTIAERTIALLAAAGQVNNALIIGDSYQRAADRLKTIARHLMNNEWMKYLYGDGGSVQGDTWKEGRLELKSGSLIWCAGQGQAIRGTKHGASRPDYLFVDDLENADNVLTPMARTKLSSWFYGDLLPALDKPGNRRVRVAATPLHPDALAVHLSKQPGFKYIYVPIEY